MTLPLLSRYCVYVLGAIVAALLPPAAVLARTSYGMLNLAFVGAPILFTIFVIRVYRLSNRSWHAWWLLLLAPICLWWPIQVLAMLLFWMFRGGFV